MGRGGDAETRGRGDAGRGNGKEKKREQDAPTTLMSILPVSPLPPLLPRRAKHLDMCGFVLPIIYRSNACAPVAFATAYTHSNWRTLIVTYAIEPEQFTVNLSLTAHDLARRCRDRCDNPSKGKQVYLNTLAVYAVGFYLQCQGYEIAEGDSSNLAMQALLDTADLVVKNYGKIECRPILPNASAWEVPPQVWGDRIAYVAVYLDASLREATVLGFAREVSTSTLPLDALEPLDNLPQYLEASQQHQTKPAQQSQERSETEPTVALGEWFEKIWEAGWQPLNALFSPESPAFAMGLRSGSGRDDTLKMGKLIHLGNRSESGQTDRDLMLILAVEPVDDDRLGIRAQLYPTSTKTYLPHNAVLALLSRSGETLREVPSRALDNFIQLPRFKCRFGEHFSLQITLGDACVREDFQLRSTLS